MQKTLWRRLSISILVASLVAAACSSDPTPTAEPSTTTAAPEPAPTTTAAPDTTTTEAPVEEPPVITPDPTSDPTPIPLRDDVRTGTLNNGLDYLVMSNDSPGQSLSIRMIVEAGGVHEDPVGTGVAHFLEHMMFNGTEKYPGNTLDDTLRAIGAEIGPDFNAATSDRWTTYEIDIADTGDNFDIALDVFHQWMTAATIDPTAVAEEAGVVREELRVRTESGDGRTAKLFDEEYFRGTPYEGVNVIGTATTVAEITADDLREYYDRWYHPEHMAIVVVGDRDLGDLESAVIEQFSDVEGRAEPGVQPDTAIDELRTDPVVRTILEPGSTSSYISVDIPSISWGSETFGSMRLLFMEIAGAFMLGRRIEEGISAGNVDLRRGGAGWFQRNVDLPFYGLNVDADDLEAGTEAIMQEIYRSVENPFEAAEYNRFVDAMRSFADQGVAQEETIQDAELANNAVVHLLDGDPFLNATDEAQLIVDLLDSISVEELNQHHRWLITQSEPIIIVVGPDTDTIGTVDGHSASLERAQQATFDDATDDIPDIDVLVAAPDPIEETARESLAESDGIQLTFANGTQVLFSPSTIAEGQVSFVSASPGGQAALDDVDGPLAPLSVDVVGASGLGGWSTVQVQRHLLDLDVSISPYISDLAEGFSGGASTDDLEALFQLVHLWVTAPDADARIRDRNVEFARDRIEDLPNDASATASTALADARTGGGRFAANPTVSTLDSFTADDALRIHSDRFASLDDNIVVIVGDTDVDTIVELSRRWLGTLPDPQVDDVSPRPSVPEPSVQRLRAGTGNSTGSWRWVSSVPGDETVSERVLAQLTTTILNDRLFTVIRERLSATYGGSAFIGHQDPGDASELTIRIDGDPARLDEIARAVEAELVSLATDGPTAADFDEAVAILRDEYNFINNGFIIQTLFDEAVRPDDVITRRAQWFALDDLRPGDVRDMVAAHVETDARAEVFASLN